MLDVFAHEPLDPADPLWRTPGVIVTPHMATMPAPGTVAEQVVANIRRLGQGAALANAVDATRGY
ncbi:Glyoxylate/hydroxypyruvate reductase A [compost metagenome]